MVSSEPMWHVSHSPLMGDALWSFCHIAGIWPPLQNCFTILHPCGLTILVLLKATDRFGHFRTKHCNLQIGALQVKALQRSLSGTLSLELSLLSSLSLTPSLELPLELSIELPLKEPLCPNQQLE